MKNKKIWIFGLVAMLAFVFVGCPMEGDPSPYVHNAPGIGGPGISGGDDFDGVWEGTFMGDSFEVYIDTSEEEIEIRVGGVPLEYIPYIDMILADMGIDIDDLLDYDTFIKAAKIKSGKLTHPLLTQLGIASLTKFVDDH